MQLRRSFVTAALASSMLAACAGFSGSPRSPISDQEGAIQGLETVYAPAEVVNCIRTPVALQDQCRDAIVQALLVAIDLRYAEFELSFLDATRYSGFGATVATLGLTGTASISGGEVARILAAIATAVTGAREAFNREVLVERTAVALQSAMRAQRNTILAQIREGMRQPAADYPVGAALSDVYAYFRAGTVLGALTGVNEAVATESRIARDRLAVASGLSQSSAAIALRRWFDEPGLPREEAVRRTRRIQEAARAEGLGDVTIASFIRDASPQNEVRQARVARRLGLTP